MRWCWMCALAVKLRHLESWQRCDKAEPTPKEFLDQAVKLASRNYQEVPKDG